MELGPEDVSLLERCPHFRGCDMYIGIGKDHTYIFNVTTTRVPTANSAAVQTYPVDSKVSRTVVQVHSL